MEFLDAALKERVRGLVGFAPTEWVPVNRGYTPTRRYVARSEAQSAFVKIGATPLTARMVNREIGIYEQMSAPFMPRLIGAERDEATPILVIEDLGLAHWPPPWTVESVRLVLEQIAAMHRMTAPIERRALIFEGREAGWPSVARDPEPFLSLGLVTAEWLERALPRLIELELTCPVDGDAVTHLDLRSDNICIRDGQVVFVDWAEAGIGNGPVDLAFFLPSLAFEGGPEPQTIMPNAPHLAALVCGFFAARAGLPDIPDAPFVRRVQREQLSAALPWLRHELGF